MQGEQRAARIAGDGGFRRLALLGSVVGIAVSERL
jgi:hypothetical protein